jgi:drug/metabolite transporter (DMT)-like permease
MNQTTGIIAAIITLVCWTIGTFSFTKAAKLYAPVSVNRVRLLYALILLSFITCIGFQINPFVLFSKPVAMQWVWLGISGIIGLSIGDHFAFTAFKILGSSRTSLFNTFAPAAALVGGIFMLNENINFIGVIGMFISIIGIAWFIKSNGSNVSGALVDSLVFPTIAFGGLMIEIVAMQFLAKVIGGFIWTVLIKKFQNV